MKAIFLMMIIATFMMGGSQVWAEDEQAVQGNVKAAITEGEQPANIEGTPGQPHVVCDHNGKAPVDPTNANNDVEGGVTAQ